VRRSSDTCVVSDIAPASDGVSTIRYTHTHPIQGNNHN
jgi:hypothetical protein